MKHYALTGGIGSGKSTVLSLFKKLGVPTFSADDSAKIALEHDADIKAKITALFGEASYVKGKLSRPFIAEQVFGNYEKLQQLNTIVHPAARKAYLKWQEAQDAIYTIYEFPLVFELGEKERFDGIILVISPETLRIQRVKNRDGLNKEAILKRMMHQWTDKQKQTLADMLIYNNSIYETTDQVRELHLQLMQT
ncbi:MAG: dephospho-CoA kinase [Flavobacteriaceae bacterium]|jgi:dephospho-CoA kinase|tara:strand:- start:183 stop:764 length:582 start_codon:yes stop_codon:yes gene_type:complete